MNILDKDTKGFTLLEILIAMAILSIGVLGVAKLQVSSSFYNTSSRLYTERASDAAGWIEQTMNLPYENDGILTPRLNDRYEIIKTVTSQVLDANLADSKTIDTIKRIDISIWENVKGSDDDDDGTIDEPGEGQDAGNLFFTTTYYKAITY